MKFTQVSQLLTQLMPNLSPGYHPLALPDNIHDALVNDENLTGMLRWMMCNGISITDLYVIASDEGVKLALPGIWLLGDEPVLLFGFKEGTPLTCPLSGLLLTKTRKNLYTATLDDVEFPVLFRLHSTTPEEDLPSVLSVSKAKSLAKVLTVGKKEDDWVKFRDVIGEGESLVVTVEGCEVKSLSKAGKNYKVWLAYTDHSTFMLSEKQYNYLESVHTYRELTETPDQPLKIRVTQDGYYNEHKMYKLTLAD